MNKQISKLCWSHYEVNTPLIYRTSNTEKGTFEHFVIFISVGFYVCLFFVFLNFFLKLKMLNVWWRCFDVIFTCFPIHFHVISINEQLGAAINSMWHRCTYVFRILKIFIETRCNCQWLTTTVHLNYHLLPVILRSVTFVSFSQCPLHRSE